MAKIGFQNNRNTYKLWNLLDDETKEKLRAKLPRKWKAPDGFASISYDPFAEVEDVETIATIMSERKAVNV